MAAMDKKEAFREIVHAIRNGSSFEHLFHHFPRNSEVFLHLAAKEGNETAVDALFLAGWHDFQVPGEDDPGKWNNYYNYNGNGYNYYNRNGRRG